MRRVARKVAPVSGATRPVAGGRWSFDRLMSPYSRRRRRSRRGAAPHQRVSSHGRERVSATAIDGGGTPLVDHLVPPHARSRYA
jgi:hypothetical protein